MVDEAVRKSMQGNKRADTSPELEVRRMLREMGYPGYRLQWNKVPGHPDIAYPGRKLAIFVNGCFWHHHEGCRYATTPRTNGDFWEAKFARNQERDARVRRDLEEMGWTVVVIWECQLKKGRRAEAEQILHAALEL
jgi:DNA mismatch endonuclease (patch repair protein)